MVCVCSACSLVHAVIHAAIMNLWHVLNKRPLFALMWLLSIGAASIYYHYYYCGRVLPIAVHACAPNKTNTTSPTTNNNEDGKKYMDILIANHTSFRLPCRSEYAAHALNIHQNVYEFQSHNARDKIPRNAKVFMIRFIHVVQEEVFSKSQFPFFHFIFHWKFINSWMMSFLWLRMSHSHCKTCSESIHPSIHFESLVGSFEFVCN